MMLGKTAFIAKSADVVGKVTLGNYISIWFQTVIRGDVDTITIGDRTNIQDGTVVHVAPGYPTIIGNGVSIGHNAIIHGCEIGDNVLIGMGAIILNGAKIGDNSIVGAGSLVTQGKIYPPNSMILGSPAKRIRDLNEDEVQSIRDNAEEYLDTMKRYM
ncbi:gamma carbonic anhydrase family protein [Acetobacterium paludosum]|uniref:Gamma carbonic anhydrase family protein n=1 Tax=Acetobacterium paludosum TaxID=52693 RepID=A0A923HTR0_9FIRM|nr:gamma carbonic anhydrase family protein [Acetobacterium paludosum]MBC3888166.1 gamma carbonic anhydrase family protein [Acetobacterium paludosum]